MAHFARTSQQEDKIPQSVITQGMLSCLYLDQISYKMLPPFMSTVSSVCVQFDTTCFSSSNNHLYERNIDFDVWNDQSWDRNDPLGRCYVASSENPQIVQEDHRAWSNIIITILLYSLLITHGVKAVGCRSGPSLASFWSLWNRIDLYVLGLSIISVNICVISERKKINIQSNTWPSLCVVSKFFGANVAKK